jgi:ferritin
MLKANVQDALNKQLNAELASSYLYLSMAAWFEEKNFRGMGHWMRTQAQEEHGHAMKIYGYIIDRGGRVVLGQINAPKNEWDCISEAFQDSYNHETQVTRAIHDLTKLAMDNADFATQSFMQWFINEQVEEEATVEQIVEKLKMVGESNVGLLFLDSELGKRAG